MLEVKTEDEPALALFERTVKVIFAKMYLPAIESVGIRVDAVWEVSTEQSAGKAKGMIVWF